jgi:GcrA cell cycle regulator
MSQTEYTADELAWLKQEWLAGDSASPIADKATARFRRLITKNSVVGVKNRQGWPGRPSPIASLSRAPLGPRHDFTEEEKGALYKLWTNLSLTNAEMVRRAKRAVTATKIHMDKLKALARKCDWPERPYQADRLAMRGATLPPLPAFPALAASTASTASDASDRPPPAHAAPAVVVQLRPPLAPSANRRDCAWPIGTPRTEGFRFCGCTALVPGRPYCAEHCAMAYVDWKERRRA